jgi:hypothetical protein
MATTTERGRPDVLDGLVWGMTLYSGVVVPIGTRILGSSTQGEVTAQVTWYLNVLGLIAILANGSLGWNLANRAARVALLLLLAAQLAMVLWRSEMLLSMQDGPASWLVDWSFYTKHRIYLWLATVQWLTALVLTVGYLRHVGYHRSGGQS